MPQPPEPRANIPFDGQAEPEYWFDSKGVAFTTNIAWACTVHRTERPDEGFRRAAAVSYGKTPQIQDLLEAGATRGDLYIDHRHPGALAKPPGLDKAFHALHPDDALVITTLDQLGYSTQKMLELAEDLRKRSTTGGDLVGYRPTFIDSQIRTAAKPIQSGKPAPQVAKDMGMSGAPFAAESKSIRPKRLLHSPCLANRTCRLGNIYCYK